MSMQIKLPDFDVLSSMHADDPEAFEQFRRHVLREAIDKAPQAHRPALEKLLDRIEEARAGAATPYEAVVVASRMMHESLNQLQAGWRQAQEAVAGMQAALLIERVRY